MGLRISKKNDEYLQNGADYEIYSDFTQAFLPHPSTGQISRRTNVDAVKLSLKNLLLTNKYERLRNPTYGGNIRRWLFEPFINTTYVEVEEQIRSTIRNYEPRVYVINVDVIPNEDNQSLEININFGLVTSDVTDELNLILYRVR